MCSFTRGCEGNIDIVSTLINIELNTIAGLPWTNYRSMYKELSSWYFTTVNGLKRKMTFHALWNFTLIERVTEYNFLGLTVNEYMNWNSHTQKIANKISRTLGVMNRLKQYLPISAMELMIHWSFRNSSLEVQTGALNGIAYQSYKNGLFE